MFAIKTHRYTTTIQFSFPSTSYTHSAGPTSMAHTSSNAVWNTLS